MPFFTAELPPIVRYDDQVEEGWIKQSPWDTDLLYYDTTRQLIGNFKVGDVIYQMRQSLQATYEPPIANTGGRFLVTQLAKVVIGRGPDLESAKYDWELKVDEKIQTLLAKQDFERTNEDIEEWEMLNRHFNLAELKYSTPADVRVYGCLEKIRGHIRQVRWLDGTISKFRRHQIPARMVTFKPGQPFEAILKRDSRNWKVLSISAVFPSHSLHEVSEAEAEAILGNIPSITERAQLNF